MKTSLSVMQLAEMSTAKASNRKMAKKYSNAKVSKDEHGIQIWSGYVERNCILDLDSEDDLREIESAINNYFREKK